MRMRMVGALLIGLPLLAHAADAPEASAPVMSGDAIAAALKPAGPAAGRSRGLSRRPDAAAAPAPQSINLNIPFEYNSSNLKPEASEQLKQLGRALASESLRSDRFLIAGHTDSKGNAQYNRQLSLKRAEAVRRFLVASGVEVGRLDTVGYGSEHPLLPEQPEAASNRRVEIQDLGAAH